jgi:hypothetical protein
MVHPAVAQSLTHPKEATVSAGVWGGRDLEMRVTPGGAVLEFDCARGEISEPLMLDEGGTFEARGTFQRQGGLIRKNQSSNGTAVVYKGSVHGDSMHLEFTLGSATDPPQAFLLTRAQSGKLRKCH